jgi:hypothetical protein
MTDEEFTALERTIACDIENSSCHFQHCIRSAQQTSGQPSAQMFAKAAGAWLEVLMASLDRLETHLARRDLNLYQLVSPVVIWHYSAASLKLHIQLFGGPCIYEEPRRPGVTPSPTSRLSFPPRGRVGRL